MVSSRFATLLVVTAGSGCLLTSDFDDYTRADAASAASSTGSGAGGGASSASTSSSSSSGTGGEGGCSADLLNDPMNCGACGWDCAGGNGCSMGVCEPVGLTLADTRWVGVHGDSVFVVAGNSCGGLGDVPILSFPILFEADSTPAFTASTFDSCALNFYEGPDRAYHAAQAIGGETPLDVCDASGCQRVEFGITGQHINGVTVVGDEIYFNLFAAGATQIRKASLSAGVPTLPISAQLAGVNVQGGGGQLIVYDPRTDALWWDTVYGSGCLYRAPLASLGGNYDCFAFAADDGRSITEMHLHPTAGVLLMINGETAGELWHVDDAGVATQIMPPVQAGVGRPLATDARYVYVGSPGGGYNVFDPVTWERVGGKFHPFGLYEISAAHPDHVVYTGVDGSLWRQRKPPPPQ